MGNLGGAQGSRCDLTEEGVLLGDYLAIARLGKHQVLVHGRDSRANYLV
jgi:hypothetical protein